jgi:hypothetical protein
MIDAIARQMPSPRRDVRIDVVRGWLQLTIFASHAAGSWIGAWLIHGAWGLSDSSEQFLFLSGLMLGSVFARKSSRDGWLAATRDMVARTFRLYRTHILVFFLFGAMIIAAASTGLWPGEDKRLGWSFFIAHPARGIIAGLTTLYQPAFMDILPVFIWSMAILPVFSWLDARIGAIALIGPIGLYAATWLFGLAPPWLGQNTQSGFNPLAWQILFILGAFLGRRMLLNGRALRPSLYLTLAAIGVLIAGLVLRLEWFGALPFKLGIPESELIIGKDGLALPRILHALALALLVSQVVPREAAWMHRSLGRWLAAAGRQSLPVFCFGLFLSWGATAVFRVWPNLVIWLDLPVLLGGCALLLCFGMWRDGFRTEPRPARSSDVSAVASRGLDRLAHGGLGSASPRA